MNESFHLALQVVTQLYAMNFVEKISNLRFSNFKEQNFCLVKNFNDTNKLSIH